MSQENRQKNKLLRKYLNKAKEEKTSAYIKNNNLYIQGEIISYEDLIKLENNEEDRHGINKENQERAKKGKNKIQKNPENQEPTSSIIFSLRNRIK